jgi:hypothetical protein
MTTENNILIALFMEAKQYDKEDNYIYFDETNTMFSNDTISIKDLKFHSDWNWLMEVVEKIEEIEGNRFKVEIYNNVCRIYDHQEYDDVIDITDETKIEAVYNACVEFIKWYNKQSK